MNKTSQRVKKKIAREGQIPDLKPKKDPKGGIIAVLISLNSSGSSTSSPPPPPPPAK